MMEKRNIIESERTPRLSKQAEFDKTEKQASELFERKDKKNADKDLHEMRK